MIDSRVPNQPKPKIVLGPQSTPSKAAMMPAAVPSQDRIRQRAYALLYESRGREPGHDLQDWLRAEQEILKPQR